MRSDSPGNSAVPKAFLGMLAIVLLVEFTISHLQKPLFKPDDWDWYLTGQSTRGRADNQQVLFLGDSLIKSAADPATFAANGISAFNLALGGGQTPAAYYLLKRLVDRNQCPPVVVFACHPKLLEDPPTHNLDHWPFLLTVSECLDYALTTGDPDLSTQVVVHMLPSIRSRREIQAQS